MATLTVEELAYAGNIDVDKLPNRLRCAVCNKAVVEAMKTECCDTVMCGKCARQLTGTCPICEYTGSPEEMTREDKRTRTTLKAHIKGELQKRNNAAAAAAAAAAKEAESKAEQKSETVAVRAEMEAEQQSQAAATLEPVREEAASTHATEHGYNDAIVDNTALEYDDAHDDRSDVEIITERPETEDHRQYEEDEGYGDSEQVQQGETGLDNGQPQLNQADTQNMPFDPQAFMNFAAMNGFNPMMAMQSGMMPPFGMMPNMMGMPTMMMDPSMMFNGGFGGMNGMMNGNMMMPGMGDMNDFNQYNSQQYGNRFDNRFSHSSNRGSGRGFGNGQDFRGRGRGFSRGGRGRGGWQHQPQQFHSHGQHNFNQQQEYQQDYDSNNAVDNAAAEDRHDHDSSMPNAERSVHEDDAYGKTGGDGPDAHAVEANANDQEDNGRQEDAVPEDTPGHEYDSHGEGRRSSMAASHLSVPASAPPINAPTGPKAMREGKPNSGRYSRPQAVASDVRSGGREQSAPFNPPTGPSAQRNKDREQNDRAGHRRRTSHSRTRSRSSGEYDRRDRSRSPRRDDKYDREDKSRRGDRKRGRDYDDDDRGYESKKRSRSGSPEDDERRRRRRDDKDRSRRDKSRDRHRDGHRSRDKEGTDDYDRRKSKSYKSSRRDRGDKYGDDFEQSEKPQGRAVLQEPQDDIGFKIKGTKSGNVDAPAETKASSTGRDPYAEERERMREQRLQRDAERRQTTSNKRGHEDGYGADDYAGNKKKKARGRGRYEDQSEDHDHGRERSYRK